MTIGTDLDAALAAASLSPSLAPLQAEIDALTARILKLEGTPTQHPPVWQVVPPISFKQGTAGVIAVTGFVTSPDGLPLTLTQNAVTLPQGITFDGMSYHYDGVGPVGAVSGVVLTANDGRP